MHFSSICRWCSNAVKQLGSIIEGRDIDILDKDEDDEEIIIDTLELCDKSYKISVQESGDTTHGFVILRELLNDETIEIKDKKTKKTKKRYSIIPDLSSGWKSTR